MKAQDDTDNEAKPSFLNLFTIHLGSRLVGRQGVLNHLAGAHAEPSFRLYWRTPLLADGVGAPPPCESLEAPDWEVVFLDVTLQFDRSKHKASTAFGALLQRSVDNTVVYVKASPLTLTQLREHGTRIGIDLDETAPDAMARTMAKALEIMPRNANVTLRKPNGTTITHGDDLNAPVRIPIQLHYEDLQETGPLTLDSESTAKLNSSTVDMLLSNFVQQDKLVSETRSDSVEAIDSVPGAQDALDVTNAFETWWSAMLGEESAVRGSIELEAGSKEPSGLNAQQQSLELASEKRTIASSASMASVEAEHSREPLPANPSASVPSAQAPDKSKEKESIQASETLKRRVPQVPGYVRTTKRRRREKLAYAKVP